MKYRIVQSIIWLLLACVIAFSHGASAQESGADSTVEDSADGLSGGPDFWTIAGSVVGAPVLLRDEPEVAAYVTAELTTGTVVRNLGCQKLQGVRWCKIRTLTDEPTDGWLPGTLVQEAAAPGDSESTSAGGSAMNISDDPNAPELFRRDSGETEVNFRGGCGVLLDQNGAQITAGSSCSGEQLDEAARLVQQSLH